MFLWRTMVLVVVAVVGGCTDLTEPNWATVIQEAHVGDVIFTATAYREDGDRLGVELLARNTGADAATVLLESGPCMIVARVFEDADHRKLRWQSVPLGTECVGGAYELSVGGMETVSTKQTWDYSPPQGSYVTAQFSSGGIFHLDAGRIDP